MEVSSQLHAVENSPQYPLDRRLAGHQSWSGCSGEEKKSLPVLGIEPGCLAHHSVIVLTATLSPSL